MTLMERRRDEKKERVVIVFSHYNYLILTMVNLMLSEVSSSNNSFIKTTHHSCCCCYGQVKIFHDLSFQETLKLISSSFLCFPFSFLPVFFYLSHLSSIFWEKQFFPIRKWKSLSSVYFVAYWTVEYIKESNDFPFQLNTYYSYYCHKHLYILTSNCDFCHHQILLVHITWP